MSEPFIAEVRIFAGNFAPRNWAFCDGQLLPISQNTALFSIIGTTFGGDGRTTTGLPNLQGRAPMHPGSAPGLTTRRLGERGGVSTVTLNQNQAPIHRHTIPASNTTAASGTTEANILAASPLGDAQFQTDTATDTAAMHSQTLSTVGGNQAHNNMPPYIVMQFIIALNGLYPSRA